MPGAVMKILLARCFVSDVEDRRLKRQFKVKLWTCVMKVLRVDPRRVKRTIIDKIWNFFSSVKIGISIIIAVCNFGDRYAIPAKVIRSSRRRRNGRLLSAIIRYFWRHLLQARFL